MNNTGLISRSALLGGYDVRKVTEYDESGCGLEYKAVSVEAIEAAPAVDAEPVRHGRWVYKGSYMDDDFDRAFEYSCSICGRRIQVYDDISQYPYCHCGAKMDGKECVPLKCGTCSNDGWDMPQCRECNEENGFKWYKRKMDVEVEHAAD